MALLLAQDHPGLFRRTPSSGDGGVDILVSRDDGWHVYQVKGFTGRMDRPRQRQVEESLQKALADPRLDGRPIAEWTLMVPINPTSGRQSWFTELTMDTPFPCSWQGEVPWDDLAARHPHVIEYFFGDGQRRIEQRLDAISRPAELAGRPVQAHDATGAVELLVTALNAEDPHFRYEIRSGPMPTIDEQIASEALLVRSRKIGDGSFVSVLVIPKHRYAAQDAQVAGTFTVTVSDPENGIDIAEAFEDFQDYGCRLEIPEGALQGEIVAPSGLSESYHGAAGTFIPIPNSDHLPLSRLQLTGPNGVIREVQMTTTSHTVGLRGGSEIHAQDSSGLLKLLARVTPPDAVPFGIYWGVDLDEIVGHPVMGVLPLVELLATVGPGHRLAWLEPHGTTVYAYRDFDTQHERQAADLQPIVEFLRDLATIQERVRGTLVVPDDIDSATATDIARAATMLRGGEIRGTWTGGSFDLRDGVDRSEIADPFREGRALVMVSELTLELSGTSYALGPRQRYFAHAVLAPDQPADERSVSLVPGPDDSVIERMTGATPTA